MADTAGAFSSRDDLDLTAFYAHVADTYANPHPQYRLTATPITGADITDGTVALLDLDASTQALINTADPVGVIKMWGTSTPPTNHLLLDGSAVSRTTWAALFALWGVTYGVGDGATTFNLMNFKLRIPIGLNVANAAYDALGELTGALTHTMDVSEVVAHTHGMQSHTHALDHGHSVSDPGHSHSMSNVVSTTQGVAAGIDYTGDVQTTTLGTSSDATGLTVVSVSGNTGGPTNNTTTSVGTTTPFSIMPPTIVVHFIVKAA